MNQCCSYWSSNVLQFDLAMLDQCQTLLLALCSSDVSSCWSPVIVQLQKLNLYHFYLILSPSSYPPYCPPIQLDHFIMSALLFNTFLEEVFEMEYGEEDPGRLMEDFQMVWSRNVFNVTEISEEEDDENDVTMKQNCLIIMRLRWIRALIQVSPS